MEFYKDSMVDLGKWTCILGLPKMDMGLSKWEGGSNINASEAQFRRFGQGNKMLQGKQY